LKARSKICVSQMPIVEKLFGDRANCEPVSCINGERNISNGFEADWTPHHFCDWFSSWMPQILGRIFSHFSIRNNEQIKIIIKESFCLKPSTDLRSLICSHDKSSSAVSNRSSLFWDLSLIHSELSHRGFRKSEMPITQGNARIEKSNTKRETVIGGEWAQNIWRETGISRSWITVERRRISERQRKSDPMLSEDWKHDRERVNLGLSRHGCHEVQEIRGNRANWKRVPEKW
jgi:hypothetical protein